MLCSAGLNLILGKVWVLAMRRGRRCKEEDL